MSKNIEWQNKGGTLIIPDNYFVYHADFDSDEPFITICESSGGGEETKLLIPKALAYYLSTHFCGSNTMHDLITENAKREVQNVIKDALGL